MNLCTDSLWKDICKIRKEAPLVHNITNYVVMNCTANALLALGASPVMAHEIREVEEMVTISRALVVNIGTPQLLLGGIHEAGHAKSPGSAYTRGA